MGCTNRTRVQMSARVSAQSSELDTSEYICELPCTLLCWILYSIGPRTPTHVTTSPLEDSSASMSFRMSLRLWVAAPSGVRTTMTLLHCTNGPTLATSCLRSPSVVSCHIARLRVRR